MGTNRHFEHLATCSSDDTLCSAPSRRLGNSQTSWRRPRVWIWLQSKGKHAPKPVQSITWGVVLLWNCHADCVLRPLIERKRRCKENRKTWSLRVHPSEEGPAQSQVWQPAVVLFCKILGQRIDFVKLFWRHHVLFCVHRKRAKLHGQFKGMVRGAQKGALSGKKMQKKKRKTWTFFILLNGLCDVCEISCSSACWNADIHCVCEKPVCF